MKRRGNAPTMQTVRRRDGQLYHTLNVQRLKNASPLQTVAPRRARSHSWAAILLLGLAVLVVVILIAATSTAHAQTSVIGEPPALHARVWLPLVIVNRSVTP